MWGNEDLVNCASNPEKYTATAKCTEKLILNTRSKKEFKIESKSEELPLGCLFSPQRSLKDVTFIFSVELICLSSTIKSKSIFSKRKMYIDLHQTNFCIYSFIHTS